MTAAREFRPRASDRGAALAIAAFSGSAAGAFALAGPLPGVVHAPFWAMASALACLVAFAGWRWLSRAWVRLDGHGISTGHGAGMAWRDVSTVHVHWSRWRVLIWVDLQDRQGRRARIDLRGLRRGASREVVEAIHRATGK